jgi:protein-S-isoprenylcysteine O-methyltransferase Ste14
MQNANYKSIINFIFVIFQFGGIGFILLTGPAFSKNMILLLLQLFGIFIGIWAIGAMKLYNLRIFPDLKKDAQFVSNGPYKLLRHPMYLGIFLFIIPLMIDKFSLVRFFVILIIIIDLLLKIIYEESLLNKHYPVYKEYSKKTFRIIPFIF